LGCKRARPRLLRGGAIDDDEFRAVDALPNACGICMAELMDVIRRLDARACQPEEP
jgi:hypothetical protein